MVAHEASEALDGMKLGHPHVRNDVPCLADEALQKEQSGLNDIQQGAGT